VKRHCIHGHLYDDANTRWISKVGAGGKRYYAKQCRTCAKERVKLKYRNDPEFREQRKEAGRVRYEKSRQARLLRQKRMRSI
jgi:hypothetical protein